jgi:hypothetical protein
VGGAFAEVLAGGTDFIECGRATAGAGRGRLRFLRGERFRGILVPIRSMPMKRLLPFLAATFAGTLAAQAPPPKTHLKVGDEAPDFTLNSSLKKQIKLSDFRGKQGVVLAFFPAAFTGG